MAFQVFPANNKGVGQAFMPCALKDIGNWYRREELEATKGRQVWSAVQYWYQQDKEASFDLRTVPADTCIGMDDQASCNWQVVER